MRPPGQVSLLILYDGKHVVFYDYKLLFFDMTLS